MVDLAGSEQLKKSEVEGVNRLEAICINRSLLSLGKCISALVKNSPHVPYYDSKLTLLLRSCFGGNSKTAVIVNASQDDSNGDQTLQTLRFGEDCSMITNVTKNASQSFGTALQVVDETLATVMQGIANLEKKNMTQLPA